MQEPLLRFRRRLFSSCARARRPASDGFRSLLFLRFNGYMNRSGTIIPGIVRRLGATPADFVVVVDNMDLPPGDIRIKIGGGDAGHNGLKSVVAGLGASGFTRIYIGIGRPSGGTSVVDHVLGVPEEPDRSAIELGCERAAEALSDLRRMPIDRLMERVNRRGS